MALEDFKKGDRVVLSRARQDDYRGRTATVRQTVKARGGEVKLDVDGFDPRSRSRYYAAGPGEIDKAESP